MARSHPFSALPPALAPLAALPLLSFVLLGLTGCDLGPSEPTEWVFPVREDQALGFIDQTGRLVIEPRFLGSLEPSEDSVAVYAEVEDDQLWGYIDFSGEWVIEPRFSRVGPFSEGLATYVDDDRLRAGYIDRRGEVVIEALFESARRFSKGLAAVKVQGLWGFIDPEGQLAIEPRFVRSRDFHHELALVEVPGGVVGYLDPQGDWAIEPTARRAEEELDPSRFEEMPSGTPVEHALIDGYDFSEGLAAVRVEEGLWGFIDRNGTWVIPPRFFAVKPFSEGLAPFRKGLTWGYVDREGREVVEARFHEAKKFTLGLAPVKVPKEGWGYVNAEGELVIGPGFDGADPFVHGLASVQTGQRWGYIDPQGRKVWEPSR